MKNIQIVLLFILSTSAIAPCFGQSWVWGRQPIIGQESWGLAIDDKTNAFIAGDFYDSIRFGSQHLKSIKFDIYLAKYDTSGNAVWAAQSNTLNSSSLIEASNVACDKAGNIMVTGDFVDSVRFGSDTLVNFTSRYSSAIFLAKCDVSGNFIWAKQSYSPPHSKAGGSGRSVATDKKNNIYLAATYQDTITIGSDTFRNNCWNNALLAKYDSSGNFLWAKSSHSPSMACAVGATWVTVDDSGNVYLAGTLYDTATFGPFTLATNGAYGYHCDVFLVKYDKNGNEKWARQSLSNDSASCIGYSVLTDKANNVYLTGLIIDSVSFGPYKLKGTPYFNIGSSGEMFISKYSPAGNIIWAKQSYSSTGGWSGYDLIKDTLNNLYFSAGGEASGAGHVVFSNDTFNITSDLFEPAFIMKLDTSGKVLCSSISIAGGEDQTNIACDPSGTYFYMSGDLADTAIFNKDTLSHANENTFIARWKSCKDIAEFTPAIDNNIKGPTIFPNPSTGIFTINFAGAQNCESGNIEVYNVIGEKVYSQFLIPNSQFLIDLRSKPNGIYFYRVITTKSNVLGEGKLIISH